MAPQTISRTLKSWRNLQKTKVLLDTDAAHLVSLQEALAKEKANNAELCGMLDTDAAQLVSLEEALAKEKTKSAEFMLNLQKTQALLDVDSAQLVSLQETLANKNKEINLLQQKLVAMEEWMENGGMEGALANKNEEISRLQQRLVAIERERESGGKRERELATARAHSVSSVSSKDRAVPQIAAQECRNEGGGGGGGGGGGVLHTGPAQERGKDSVEQSEDTCGGAITMVVKKRERERESLLGTALNDGVKGKKDEGEEGRRKGKKEMRTKVGGLVGDLGTLDNP